MSVTPNTATIIALADNPQALTAYLAACEAAEMVEVGRGVEKLEDGSWIATPETPEEKAARMARPDAKRPKVKRAPRSTPAATPKANGRTPKAAPTEWVVNPAWEGVPAGPRMMAAAIYHGLPVATCNKLAGNKLALSLAIAKQRGIPVKQG